MARRNPRIDALAGVIPGLLDFIEESSKLSLSEMQRALAVHLEARNYVAIRRQWLRWTLRETVPGAMQLYSIVAAARLRGWLAGIEESVVDVGRLLKVLEEETEKIRDAEVVRARAAMAPDAITLAAGIERMILKSGRTMGIAVPAAMQAIKSMLADRLRKRLEIGESPVAWALVKELGPPMEEVARDLEELELEFLYPESEAGVDSGEEPLGRIKAAARELAKRKAKPAKPKN